jgi:hypothetical protein
VSDLEDDDLGSFENEEPHRLSPPSLAERYGELHAAMRGLVGAHGLDACFAALSAVRDDVARPKSRRTGAQFAASFEGRFVSETSSAVLWFCPGPATDEDPARLEGQAAWIPRALIVTLIDPVIHGPRRHPLDPPPALGVLTTSAPIQWRAAYRVGSNVRFRDEARRAG